MATITEQQYKQLKDRGLGDATIKKLASERGLSLPEQGIITGLVRGAVKGLVGDIARPTAQLAQNIGQRTLAAITPKTLPEIQKETGLKSLKDTTPEGQGVVQSLKTQGGAEMAGRIGINIASFFLPASKPIAASGRALQTGGEILTKAGIGVSAKEASLLQAYKARYGVAERIISALKGTELSGKPITNAETAIRQKLFGTESMIGVQAKRASARIWQDVISPALKSSEAKINMPSFIDEIAQQIDAVPELTRKGELTDALNAFKDDYGKVGEISLEKLQQFKEGWAKFLPDKVYKGKSVASSFKEIQRMAASLARNKIYMAIQDVEGKAAYFDYGNLKNLEALGQKAMTGSKLKGGAGSFVSGLYDKVITPIATTGGLTLYKLGEGFEFVGRAGAKTLGQLFK